MNIKVF